MPSPDISIWRWRGNLTWALLGPSIVLLVQVEALLLVAEALGAFNLGSNGHRTSFLVAISVLVLVTAAQVSTQLWNAAKEARGELLTRRREVEAKVFSKGREADWREPGLGRGWVFRRPATRIRRLGNLLLNAQLREGWLLAQRFGFEPTWGVLVLNETGLPAARRFGREMRLQDARAAGQSTAVLVAAAALALSVGATLVPGVIVWRAALLAVAILLLFAARCLSVARSARTLQNEEMRYYSRLERLLELHRFDLYRALALPVPRDAGEEREHPLADWRRGEGRRMYALEGEGEDSNLQEQVAGLTGLLRGAELVAYAGFVSWEVGSDSIQLAFSSGAILPDGNAWLEVEGTSTATHAPFELTANSEHVALVQVRAAVQAPVDGRTARVTFDFTPRADAGHGEAPVIWIEIRQRARFIRLLRVREPSSAPPGADGSPARAGNPAPTSPDRPG